MMHIGVRVIIRVVVGKSVGFGPNMFPIIEVVATILFRKRRVAINGDDLAGRVWILVGDFEDVPCVGCS